MKLPSFSDLISQTWNFYKGNFAKVIKLFIVAFLSFLVIIPLVLILVVFVGVPAAVFKSTVLTMVLGGAALIAGIVLYTLFATWVMAVVMAGVAQIDNKADLQIKALFSQTRSKVVKLWWSGFLASLIIVSGYLLFIIPGIIFTIWFSLVAWIVVLEGDSGINALAKSKAYIKGNTLKVFLYMFGLQIVLWLVSYIPSWIFNQLNADSLAGVYSFLIQILVYPVSLFFGYFIYKSLKGSSVPVKPRRAGYVAGAVLGVLAIVLFVGAGIFITTRLMQAFNTLDSSLTPEEMQQLEQMYEEYQMPSDIDNYTGSDIQYY